MYLVSGHLCKSYNYVLCYTQNIRIVKPQIIHRFFFFVWYSSWWRTSFFFNKTNICQNGYLPGQSSQNHSCHDYIWNIHLSYLSLQPTVETRKGILLPIPIWIVPVFHIGMPCKTGTTQCAIGRLIIHFHHFVNRFEYSCINKIKKCNSIYWTKNIFCVNWSD